MFLLDLLNGNRSLIERWRCADEEERNDKFKPVEVRKALDSRDGLIEKKRHQHYKLLSELAVHPTMQSVCMMRPRRDGDAQSMPFVEEGVLKPVLFEMARLAVMSGEILDHFFFNTWADGHQTRVDYKRARRRWLQACNPRF